MDGEKNNDRTRHEILERRKAEDQLELENYTRRKKREREEVRRAEKERLEMDNNETRQVQGKMSRSLAAWIKRKEQKSRDRRAKAQEVESVHDTDSDDDIEDTFGSKRLRETKKSDREHGNAEGTKRHLQDLTKLRHAKTRYVPNATFVFCCEAQLLESYPHLRRTPLLV